MQRPTLRSQEHTRQVGQDKESRRYIDVDKLETRIDDQYDGKNHYPQRDIAQEELANNTLRASQR